MYKPLIKSIKQKMIKN